MSWYADAYWLGSLGGDVLRTHSPLSLSRVCVYVTHTVTYILSLSSSIAVCLSASPPATSTVVLSLYAHTLRSPTHFSKLGFAVQVQASDAISALAAVPVPNITLSVPSIYQDQMEMNLRGTVQSVGPSHLHSLSNRAVGPYAWVFVCLSMPQSKVVGMCVPNFMCVCPPRCLCLFVCLCVCSCVCTESNRSDAWLLQ